MLSYEGTLRVEDHVPEGMEYCRSKLFGLFSEMLSGRKQNVLELVVVVEGTKT